MPDNKTVTFDAIRAAGGIVHSDGNIFFTNIDQLHAAMLAAAPTPAAQSAGKEAAALTDDQWLDLAQRHANADWNSDKPDGFLAAVKALCEDFANIYAAPVNGGERETVEQHDDGTVFRRLAKRAADEQQVDGDEYGVLHRMAYILGMYPEGAAIPFQVLEVLRKQYRAAMQARALTSPAKEKK